MNSETDSPSFRRRLEQLMGLEQPFAWAKRIGIPAATFDRMWNKGVIPSGKHLARIALAEDVELNWLVLGRGPMRTSEGSAGLGEDRAAGLGPGFVLIPRYDVEASAGPGTFTDRERVVDYMAFREEFVRRALRVDPATLALITAVGDSMMPTINPGDLLLIDTAVDRIIDDAIYVLVKRGELVVKRVQQFFNGGVTVKSDNPAYVDETLGPSDADQVQVAGRVRWIGRLI